MNRILFHGHYIFRVIYADMNQFDCKSNKILRFNQIFFTKIVNSSPYQANSAPSYARANIILHTRMHARALPLKIPKF